MSTIGKIHDELSRYRPAVWLEQVLPQSLRTHLRHFCSIVIFVAVLLYVSVLLIQFSNIVAFAPSVANYLSLFSIYQKVVLGMAAAGLAIWLVLFALDAFWNTYYFRGLEPGLKQNEFQLAYEVAVIITTGTREDLTESLFAHPLGQELCVRLGIKPAAIAAFVRDRSTSVPIETLEDISKDSTVDFADFAKFVFEHDEKFSEFLFDNGIQKKSFYGAADWIQYRIREKKRKGRWWARERLGRISPIGRSWAYGEIYELEKYAKDIRTTSEYSSLAARSGYATERLHELEELLQKAKDANAMLVGEEGVGKMDVVLELYRQLTAGTMQPPLADKRLVVLDTNQLIAAAGNKTALEQTIHAVFSQAVRAGNIILVLENMPSFVRSARAAGVNVADLLDRYLASTKLQVVATAAPNSFHKVLEPNPRLMNHFGVVQLKDPNKQSLLRILIQIAHQEESSATSDITFTYQGLAAIAQGAKRYITGRTMPDAAIDLLMSVASHAQRKGLHYIGEEVVMEVIQEKTGVPAGGIDEKEKRVLTHLEETLHQRVIGQDPAVNQVANALRNARAGVNDPDKPIGTFLFFGPTGVGKTETTKALADAYFGGEEAIQRLDSSEYSTRRAVRQLVGADGSAGRLANLVREQPYGVLLVDEFEKAHQSVHDLFLQILDEGYFTDGRGKEVNLRNMMIIATSNAGSDMIFEQAKETDADLQEARDTIVDALIERGIFRPELLNRFDGLILFSPLTKKQLHKIAQLQLARLQERVRQRGYRLEITDPLIDFLVEEGYEPQFGARAMNRVIQDDVEKLIADKIIADDVQKGDTIRFTQNDLQEMT